MFRKLKADEIQARVSQVTAKGCTLLLYKDARVDRAILDETVGPMNWQNDFKIIDGKMYGYVSIWDDEKKQWITKCDCGTESNTEAEKGQASDCFKRAGFKWGIGVELYSAPFIFLHGTTIKDEYNSKPNKDVYKLKDKNIKYQVQEIGYSDNGDINKLKIVDDKKNVVFEMGKKIEQKPQTITADDKALIDDVSQCTNIKELELFYKEIAPNLSSEKARAELVKKCKARKEELNNG